MEKKTRNLVLVAMIVLLFLSVVWVWLGRAAVELGAVTSAVEGNQAPDFSTTMQDGSSVHLSDYAGRILVLNFWASWCVPCQQEMPTFNQVYQEIDQDEVDFLMLNVTATETKAKAERFLAAHEFDFPVAFDLDNSVSRDYQVSSYPVTVMVDAEGKICKRHTGIMNEAMLLVAIEECDAGGAR